MINSQESVGEDRLTERYDALVERAENQDIDWESAIEDVPDSLPVKVFLLATLVDTDPEAAVLAEEVPDLEGPPGEM